MRDGRFVTGAKDTGTRVLAEWPREFSEGEFRYDYGVAWFDIESPKPDDLAWLGSRFHFHPLAIEDCTHFDQRPKIEEYSGHLFLVVHGLKVDGDGKLEVYELHCFISKNLVVTVHEGVLEPLEMLKQRFVRNRNLMPFQEDFLLHKILDAVMDSNPHALDVIEDEIERLDEEVLRSAQPEHVERIHGLQQRLNRARQVLSPQREIFSAIVNGSYSEITETAAVYFRDVYDHLIRITASVEALRENLWSIREVYLAVAAHRTNETVKRLTVFSVIFLPLTFITGFFGMNFTQIPWGSAAVFALVSVCVALLPLGMLVWFHKRNWL